jgi:catechol 2,3-dioxygenase-like lactoylglutathione lyase family enzyme
MRTDLTRRGVLATLATGVVGGAVASAITERRAFAADAPFRCGGLDHLALAVDDIEKSVHFYARVFGATVMREKTNARHYIKLGPNYIAMAPPGQGQTAPSINHFCPGIVNFDLAATKQTLDQMGIKYREAPPVGLFVPDPDGTLVQLWTENSWSRLGETAAPDAMGDAPPVHGEPLLQPTAIDHILVLVSDVPKAVAFYQKILGGVIRVGGTPERTWFSAGGSDHVVLGLVEPGDKLGIDHYCLTAQFDRAALTKGIEAAGGKIIEGVVSAGFDFLDVNGIHVQILPPARA